MRIETEAVNKLGRRTFLRNGTLLLAASTIDAPSVFAAGNETALKVGLVTDLHDADKPPAGTRHYRETLSKLEEAASQFEQDKPTFLVELGDLIDAADTVETEERYLTTINREFSAICEDRHYVLGNHCVDTRSWSFSPVEPSHSEVFAGRKAIAGIDGVSGELLRWSVRQRLSGLARHE